MAKDLTIRLLGRPQVTKDDQVGYQRIARQYVVEGYRASYAGINDSSNPLFLAVGTADEEFTDHYLVNQKIAPKQGSVDTAYLTREFVEIRNTHVQESVVATNDVRRIRRTFVVLRADHARGYSTAQFAKHPLNGGGYEPWSYAPANVSTPPGVVTHSLPTDTGLTKPPVVENEALLYDVLNGRNDVNTGEWLKGTVQTSMSQPGVDVWSIEWVTHNTPYWSAGVKRGGASGFKPPQVVSFDEDGLRIADFGTGSGSSTYNQISQFNFFVVAETLPSDFANYWGGTANITPSVMLDFSLVAYEGHRNSFDFKSLYKNAIFKYDTNSNLAGGLATAIVRGYKFTGSYNTALPQLPKFKNVRIIDGGGTITWQHTYQASSSNATIAGVQVAPVFTSSDGAEKKKIWKISTTYVG